MEYKTPKSTCLICQSEYARSGITRHIKSCLSRHFQKIPKGKIQELYYLHVNSVFNPDYFLHLLMSGDTTLEDLDLFLRGIWLECCGHMSAFSVKRYGRELDMRLKIKKVLYPGAELIHMYDFGDTTELSVKGIDTYFGHTEKNKAIRSLPETPNRSSLVMNAAKSQLLKSVSNVSGTTAAGFAKNVRISMTVTMRCSFP